MKTEHGFTVNSAKYQRKWVKIEIREKQVHKRARKSIVCVRAACVCMCVCAPRKALQRQRQQQQQQQKRRQRQKQRQWRRGYDPAESSAARILGRSRGGKTLTGRAPAPMADYGHERVSPPTAAAGSGPVAATHAAVALSLSTAVAAVPRAPSVPLNVRCRHRRHNIWATVAPVACTASQSGRRQNRTYVVIVVATSRVRFFALFNIGRTQFFVLPPLHRVQFFTTNHIYITL